jgi:hypothetical protein
MPRFRPSTQACEQKFSIVDMTMPQAIGFMPLTSPRERHYSRLQRDVRDVALKPARAKPRQSVVGAACCPQTRAGKRHGNLRRNGKTGEHRAAFKVILWCDR